MCTVFHFDFHLIAIVPYYLIPSITLHRDSKEKPTVQMVNLQGYATQFVFTQEVDYALIVCRKQSDCIFEEEHEGCIDHTICKFIGIDLEER